MFQRGWLGIFAVAPLLSLAAAVAVESAEPAAEFLNGLRARGYFDVAETYLADVKDNQLVSPQFKQSILYEKGATLVMNSRTQRDRAVRQRQLTEAQAAFKEFIDKFPNHPQVSSANRELATIIAEEAQLLVATASRPGATNKDQLLTEARKLFDEAIAANDKVRASLRSKLEQLGSGALGNMTLEDQRDLWRREYVGIQLLIANLQFEKAKTLKGTDDKQHKALIETAAKSFGEVFEKYRQFLPGQIARVQQGRCFQAMGNYKEAISYYDEVLAQDAPVLRNLQAAAARYTLECHLEIEPAQPAAAVAKGTEFLEKARPTSADNQKMDWIAVHFHLGKAAYLLSKTDKQQRTNLRNTALRELRIAARNNTPLQEEARQLLAELGRGGTVEETDESDPETFLEAMERATELRQSLANIDATLKVSRARLPRLKGDDRKQVEANIAAALEQRPKVLADAQRMYTLAYRMADPETDPEELNLIRYFLSYFNYTGGDYWRCGVMSEFVARRYPNGSVGRPCSELALAAWQNIYQQAPPDDREFEAEQLGSFARYITSRDEWADTSQAGKAYQILINILVVQGKLEEAVSYLDKITDEEQRASSELKTGQAMWAEYLRDFRKLRELQKAEEPAPMEAVQALETRIARLKSQAEQTLTAGIARMQKSEEPSRTMPRAMLFLSQLYVESGEPVKAIGLLEDPKFGPLTLIDKGDELAQSQPFQAETYKAALRAYIAALPKDPGNTSFLTKANATMTKLMDLYGDTPAEKKRLVAMFIGLARELASLVELADSGERAALLKGFESFLGRVSEQSDELSVRNWVAETFKGMAEKVSEGAAPSGNSKRLFELAASEYQGLIDEDAQRKDYLSDDLEIQIRLQRARVLRTLGQFDAAIEEYANILRKKNTALNVQIEAAETFQQQGTPETLRKAMGGAVPEKVGRETKNLVWGWVRLNTITQNYIDRFGETYFLSRRKFNEARYELALHESTSAKEAETLLSKSLDDIRAMQARYPELEASEPYEDLKAKIEKRLKTYQ